MPPAIAICGAAEPNLRASRTPDQPSWGCAARKRRGPVGGAAYGMPANSRTSCFARPWTALTVKRERIEHWVAQGAQMSDTVRTLIARNPGAPATGEEAAPSESAVS